MDLLDAVKREQLAVFHTKPSRYLTAIDGHAARSQIGRFVHAALPSLAENFAHDLDADRQRRIGAARDPVIDRAFAVALAREPAQFIGRLARVSVLGQGAEEFSTPLLPEILTAEFRSPAI